MALIDVIKYEGTNDVLVFKHPTVDFNTKTQLIVHDKQEAVVFMNGEAQGIYSSGRYELQSKNIPGVKHLIALVSGGELANHCEVYFINKLLFSNIPWVTTAMDIQDSTIGNYYSFRSQGFFTVTVGNAMDLFNVIGNGEYFTTDALKTLFSERITSNVKEVLSIAMSQERLSYGEINSHLTTLSERAKAKLQGAFTAIGLNLVEFKFDSVNMDKDAEFDKHRGHLGERSGQQIEGYTYDTKRMYDVMEAQAHNSAAGGAMGAMGAGAGYGMAMGQVYGGMVGRAAGNAFGNQMGGNVPNIAKQPTAGIVQPHPVRQAETGMLYCSSCQKPIQSDWKCCPYCGTDIAIDKKCQHCGTPLPVDIEIKFCPVCRTPVNN